MRDYKDKQVKTKPWRSPIVLIIALVLIFLVARGTYRISDKHSAAKSARQHVEAELAELENKLDDLQTDIDQLATAKGVEKAIRNRFNVVKPDEQLVIIVDNEQEEQVDAGSIDEESEQGRSFWNFVRGLF